MRKSRLTNKERREIEDLLQLYLLCSSEGVVMTIYDVKSDENDYKFLGSISESTKKGYYTVPDCELLGYPVTIEELMTAKDFAQMMKCRRKYYLGGAKPCVHNITKFVKSVLRMMKDIFSQRMSCCKWKNIAVSRMVCKQNLYLMPR